MRVALIAGAAVLLLCGTYLFQRRRINGLAARLLQKIADSCVGISFFKLLETFFNEAAVLWFVFPLLDAIYEEHKNQKGIGYIGIGVSWLVALMLGTFAAVFAKIAENLEKKERLFERENRE